MKTKWRGIQTTQLKINESKPVTIVNRFGQLSMSLPRIDDKKRWAGYPGITGISRKLGLLIPKCLYYVEPFAGAAKVYQEVKKRNNVVGSFILNDKAKYVYDWLRQNFSNVLITNTDFVNSIKYWDSKKTFFLIDLPWFKTYYNQKFSCFDRESVKKYDEEIIEICKNLKGKFIITTRKENKIMLRSPFNNYYLRSEYVVCGKYPKVLLTTNIKLGLQHARKL